MYYAIYHPYGIRTMSHGDTLMRFKTAEQRKHTIEEKDYYLDGIKYEEVSRDYARKLFPKAFKSEEYISDYEMECWESDSDLCGVYYGEIWTGNPTGGHYKYMN